MNDSLFNQLSFNNLQELKIRYETQQNEFKIIRLQQEQIDNRQHLTQQKRWLWTIAIILFLLVLLVSLWIYKNRKRRLYLQKIHKQQQQILLQERNHTEEKIKLQSRELTSSAMFSHEKQQQISKAVQQLNTFKKYFDLDARKSYTRIISDLDKLQDQGSWKAFEKYFLETHQGFYEKLGQEFSNLTPSEKKLCAFLRLNLSTKEIATILHHSPKSVEVSRSRLRKKLLLTNTNITLVEYLSNF